MQLEMASSAKSYDGLYFEAAAIVEDVRAGKARIKSLCFRSKQRNKQALFALVTESCKSMLAAPPISRMTAPHLKRTLDYKILRDALEAAQFFKTEKRASERRRVAAGDCRLLLLHRRCAWR